MDIRHPNSKDISKWQNLIKVLPNCIGTGHILYESTRELHFKDGSLTAITPASDKFIFCVNSNERPKFTSTRFLQFRVYKLAEKGFAGRHVWAVKIISSSHSRNPGLKLKTVGWMVCNSKHNCVTHMQDFLKGTAKIYKDPCEEILKLIRQSDSEVLTDTAQ